MLAVLFFALSMAASAANPVVPAAFAEQAQYYEDKAVIAHALQPRFFSYVGTGPKPAIRASWHMAKYHYCGTHEGKPSWIGLTPAGEQVLLHYCDAEGWHCWNVTTVTQDTTLLLAYANSTSNTPPAHNWIPNLQSLPDGRIELRYAADVEEAKDLLEKVRADYNNVKSKYMTLVAKCSQHAKHLLSVSDWRAGGGTRKRARTRGGLQTHKASEYYDPDDEEPPPQASEWQADEEEYDPFAASSTEGLQNLPLPLHAKYPAGAPPRGKGKGKKKGKPRAPDDCQCGKGKGKEAQLDWPEDAELDWQEGQTAYEMGQHSM